MAAQIILNTNVITFGRILRFGAWCFVFAGLLLLVPTEGLSVVEKLRSETLIADLTRAFPRLLMLSGIPLIAAVELYIRWQYKQKVTAKGSLIFAAVSIAGVAICGLAVPFFYLNFMLYQGSGGFLTLITVITGSAVGILLMALVIRRPRVRRRRY